MLTDKNCYLCTCVWGWMCVCVRERERREGDIDKEYDPCYYIHLCSIKKFVCINYLNRPSILHSLHFNPWTICLTVYLFDFLSMCVYDYLSDSLGIWLSIHHYVCFIYVCQYFFLTVYLSKYYYMSDFISVFLSYLIAAYASDFIYFWLYIGLSISLIVYVHDFLPV